MERVGFINDYADRNELNGACFKEDEIDIQNIKELHLEKDYQLSSSIDWEIQDKINELIKVIKQLDNKIKEKQC